MPTWLFLDTFLSYFWLCVILVNSGSFNTKAAMAASLKESNRRDMSPEECRVGIAGSVLHSAHYILQHNDRRQRVAEILRDFELPVRLVRVTLGQVQGDIDKDSVLANAIYRY